MSGIKRLIEELWDEQNNPGTVSAERLAEAARLVGGVVDGRMIRCRSVAPKGHARG